MGIGMSSSPSDLTLIFSAFAMMAWPNSWATMPTINAIQPQTKGTNSLTPGMTSRFCGEVAALGAGVWMIMTMSATTIMPSMMNMDTKTSGMHRVISTFQKVFGEASAFSRPWPRYVRHMIIGP